VPNFVSFAASIAELADGEKSRTESLSHSLTLLNWMCREPKLSLRNLHSLVLYLQYVTKALKTKPALKYKQISRTMLTTRLLYRSQCIRCFHSIALLSAVFISL